MNQSRTVRVGIIGGGFGALVSYTILRFKGLSRHEIAVFSPDTSPEKSWERFARAIKLKQLRSESTGHFYPTDAPGLATVEAIKTWSLGPIVKSWFDNYHPTIEFFLEHTRKLSHKIGFMDAIVPAAVSRIDRLPEQFALYDEQGKELAKAQHIILAVGHGPLRVPEAVEKFREEHPGDSRVSLSYENKTYGPHTVLVIGDGITAATEWMNVLEAGGAVAAVSRDGFELNQALQVPRKYFSLRGIKPYRKNAKLDRLRELRQATRGSIPGSAAWNKIFAAAEEREHLGLAEGNVQSLKALPNGRLAVEIGFSENSVTEIVEVDQVISATGFMPPSGHPLLKKLIETYNLPVHDGIIELDDDCCLPILSQPGSIAAVVGPASAWSVPGSDSLVGMKIAARTFARLIVGPDSLAPGHLASQFKRWFTIVRGKELA